VGRPQERRATLGVFQGQGRPPKKFLRVTPPVTGRGASLLSCGDVEANPRRPPTDRREEDYVVVPDLVEVACGRLSLFPVRDAFATPENHRFSSYWTEEEDAFAQQWDYATAGAL